MKKWIMRAINLRSKAIFDKDNTVVQDEKLKDDVKNLVKLLLFDTNKIEEM